MVKRGMARAKGPPTTNVTIRMFVELKREVERIAHEESRSVANMIVAFIKEGLAGRRKKSKKS